MKSLLIGLLVFTAASSFAAPTKYKCFGTEPFWNVQIDSESVILAAPGEDGQKLVITQRSYPVGTAPSFGEVIKAQGAGVDAVLTIRADAKCNDGMSDAEYSHEIWFLKGSRLVVGCCNPRK